MQQSLHSAEQILKIYHTYINVEKQILKYRQKNLLGRVINIAFAQCVM